MLGFLPGPIGDELLYSMLARYRAMAGTDVSKPTLNVAFGGNDRYIHVGLPGRLRHLASSIPGSKWTAERLAIEHTLLPYYGRLIPASVYQRITSSLLDGWLTGGSGGLVPFFASVTAHRWLNFCPACVASGPGTGAPSWQRVHQLPGVFCCPEHRVGLRTTEVAVMNQAQLIECPSDPGSGVPIESLLDDTTAASVAKNSEWLLLNPAPPTEARVLRAGVRAMLRDAGWISDNNQVRRRLRHALAEKLGEGRLKAMGCRLGLEGNRDAWLGWLWEDRPAIRAHPLRYLLLLAFLERDASDLFAFVGQDVPDEVPVNRLPRLAAPGVGDPDLVARYRTAVLTTMENHPSAGRTKIRKMIGAATAYLSKHDEVWLARTFPTPQSKATIRDWTALDERLLPLVQAAIANLRAARGRPIRLTVTSIAVEAGKRAILLNERERLPLCTAAAERAAEDDVAYGMRRLDWAANEMVMRGEETGWAAFASLARLQGKCRPALEAYALALHVRMQAAERGKPLPALTGPRLVTAPLGSKPRQTVGRE